MKTSLLSFLVALSLALPAQAGKKQDDPDPDFDRLDGKGKSGKRVDVIEWEGNLEVHVYPGGSLRGLALKLDKRNKDKPVMVIGYRFDNDPKNQLIRRAILGIPMNESFKVFRDPSAGSEYDKIVISNHVLSGQLTAFKLDPPPSQLYPEGHPENREIASTGEDHDTRKPARAQEQRPPQQEHHTQEKGEQRQEEKRKHSDEDGPAYVDEDGRISPFFMGGERKSRSPRLQ